MSKKIKILRIMHRINISGPTYHAAYLTKFLDKEIFETLLISGNINKKEESGEYILKNLNVEAKYVKNMFRKINIIKDFMAFREILKIIKNFEPDIIHTHAAKSGFIGRIAGIYSNVPIIVHTFHGHVFHSYFNFFKTKLFIYLEKILALKTSKIIAISNVQKNELSSKYKIASPKKFKTINLGFDLERFTIDRDIKRLKFRNEFMLNNTEIAIGIIGRLTAIKNQAFFLDVFNHIKKYSKVKCRAFIIGGGEDKLYLESYASKLGLEYTNELNATHNKELCFTSWRNDIDVVNSGLDIICLTSLNEGTPVSLIEAMASGKPIISTRVGGIEDVVEDYENGFLINQNDFGDYTRKLLNLVKSSDLRQKMSTTSTSKAISKFSYKRLVNEIESLYLNLSNKCIQQT